ncbi:uncharacterized protein LOC125272989 isoform X2 [Megalobrama amblycephala]|uniref:uncharacterized protein LOC125272989 isoform X2 n=1 Tax=Megalobrama amblycephala TaxID=75352 RepID=UPI0020147549|nr:uncharacterized protein LOC125272989 isoform X2 [Megalobrama amblycephala]
MQTADSSNALLKFQIQCEEEEEEEENRRNEEARRRSRKKKKQEEEEAGRRSRKKKKQEEEEARRRSTLPPPLLFVSLSLSGFVYKCRQSDGCGSVLIEKSDLVGIYNNMKNYSEISVFLLIFCVFGADGDEDEMKRVMEGDSVTLDTDLREEFILITWWFRYSNSIIAETDGYEISYPEDERFRGRLKLNHQTGSLTINYMRITDSGVYELEIDHNSGTSNKTYSVTVHVFGADEDGVKRESVMEGDSVTLGPRLREKFNLIKWRFGVSGSIIAETDGNKISYTNDERFRDRLSLNNQTGSLTINNMRITDTGIYHLQIDHNSGTSNQIFSVTCVPALSPVYVAAIVVVGLLVLSAAAVSAVLYYHHIFSELERQNPVTDKKKRKLLHQTRSQKSTDSGYSDLQIKPCSEGSRGKNANKTSEIPLLSKEDPDRARVQPTT